MHDAGTDDEQLRANTVHHIDHLIAGENHFSAPCGTVGTMSGCLPLTSELGHSAYLMITASEDVISCVEGKAACCQVLYAFCVAFHCSKLEGTKRCSMRLLP